MHSEDVRQFLPRARASADGRVLEKICLGNNLSWKQLCRRKYVECGPAQCGQRIAALVVILYNIADALRFSLVHTNKTFGRLRRLGMYTQANGTLTLTNRPALEGVAQHFEQALARRPLI